MKFINVTKLRNNIYEYLDQTVCYNEPITVSTKSGNAVILSEEDYNNLMETLHINSTHGLKEDIIKGMNEPIEECASEEEAHW